MTSLSLINLSKAKNHVSPGNHTYDCHAGFQLTGGHLTEGEWKWMMNAPFSIAAEPKSTCWNPCGVEYFGRENVAYTSSAENWVFLCITLSLKKISTVYQTLYKEYRKLLSGMTTAFIYSLSLNPADCSSFYEPKNAAPLSHLLGLLQLRS